MRISLTDSVATGFKRWSSALPAEARLATLATPTPDLLEPVPILAERHRPWLVPGTGRL
jgi:hypothetical protein